MNSHSLSGDKMSPEPQKMKGAEGNRKTSVFSKGFEILDELWYDALNTPFFGFFGEMRIFGEEDCHGTIC